MWKRLWRAFTRLTLLAVFVTLAALLPRSFTTLLALPRMHAAESAPSAPVAIVYGAGIRRDGGPSAVLRDRMDAAIDLYHAGKVQTLLLSGATLEPTAMQGYALSEGVAAEDLLLDEGGLRTYDTCYRAANVYGVHHAILVTNRFHLPRALYLCNQFGVQVEGVYAEESRYWRGALVVWNIRETLATVVALWEAHISRPLPTYPGAMTFEEEMVWLAGMKP